MRILHTTCFLAAVFGLLLAPAPGLQAGEKIIIDRHFFVPGLVYRVDSPFPRHRYRAPGHSYVYGPVYGPSYYYVDRDGDDGPRFYRGRYYDGPRHYRDRYYDEPFHYRDRDRYYREHRYYRDRDRGRYYDDDDYRRYREERYRRDTYKEQRIPKEQKTLQERRWSR